MPRSIRGSRRARWRKTVHNRRFPTFLLTLLSLAGCTSSVRKDPPELSRATRSPAAATDPSTESSSGSWRRIAPPPIPPAAGMAAAWTGRQLVVWGGGSGRASEDERANWHPSGAGAAYDPATNRWVVLPPAPIPARLGATAVWSGREVLIWGGAAGDAEFFGDGAAYDPATRRWRVLPPAPIGARTDHEATWTGREMFLWGGIQRCCPIDSELHDPAAAAYDPATNQWRRAADVPAPWSGDDGTAVTLAEGDRPLIWRRGRLGAPATAAAEVWGEVTGLQPPPVATDTAVPATTGDPLAMATVAGGEVFTWTGRSGQLRGLAWRPSDATWRRTATLEAQRGGTVTAGGPGQIYAAVGQSARILRYSVADDRWDELPLPPIPTRSAAVLAWTGDALLFWGGVGDESPEMDGAAWRCC